MGTGYEIDPFDLSPDTVRETASGADAPECVLRDPHEGVWLFHGDCFVLMERLVHRNPAGVFDMIFADPPYFLSNGGITCHAGRMVTVDKGAWDQSRGAVANHEFNRDWLRLCQALLKPNGTIWVSGTHHVIHSVGYAMQELGFRILNDITWEKPNPPPNLSCRYFTHATETIIWAAKNEKSRHRFNYEAMRALNGGRQMQSVWRISAPSRAEKVFGKHPTQKPVELLERILLACTDEGDLVLDPFAGSSSTGVAAIRLRRKFVGVELEEEYVALSLPRLRQALSERRGNLALDTTPADKHLVERILHL